MMFSIERNLPISEVSSLSSSMESLDSTISEDEALISKSPLGRGLSTVSEGHDRTGTIFSSIFTLVSTMIGGGLLSLPFAFEQGGYAVSSVVLIFVLAASTHGGFLVINSKKYCHGKIRNIEDVARVAFGRKGQVSPEHLHLNEMKFEVMIILNIMEKPFMETSVFTVHKCFGEFVYKTCFDKDVV